jgi:hypothetical protein
MKILPIFIDSAFESPKTTTRNSVHCPVTTIVTTLLVELHFENSDAKSSAL